MKAYTSTSGEVMAGRQTAEGRHLTRLSIWLRNESLLIVRTDAPTPNWPIIGPKAVSLLGSLRFAQALPEDPVLAAFGTNAFAVPSVVGRPGTMTPALPPAWRTLPITNEDASKGVLRFYVDDAATSKSSGAILYSFGAESDAKSFEEAKGEGFAEVILEILLDNLLPGKTREHDRVSSGRFADQKAVTTSTGSTPSKSIFWRSIGPARSKFQ